MAKERSVELDAILIGMVGHRLTVGEIIEALELSPTTYYQQRNEGRLLSLDNVVTAARNLGLNEVEALVRCNLLDPVAVEEFLGGRSGGPLAPQRGKGVTKTKARNRTMRPSANAIRVDSAPL